MKKIDPQHYLTDALVTSDEWDSFDYDIKCEIEGMAEIGDDDNPKIWEETFAATYLRHVEKLLREKNQYSNYDDYNIRELQTRITKYEHVKTFLLTLRIATVAYRAGLIPKFITEGEAHLKYRVGQSVKGQKHRSHGGKTPAEIQIRNNQIVEQFKEARLKNRSLTPSGFSKKHAAKYRLKPRRVQDILKMAVGN